MFDICQHRGFIGDYRGKSRGKFSIEPFFLCDFILLGSWSVSLKDPVACDECDPSLTIIQGVNLLTGMYSGVANNEREHSSRVPVTAFMTS